MSAPNTQPTIVVTKQLLLQLKQEATKLKQECDNEERHINFYQQERTRINYIWMNQKKKIDQAKADLINVCREKEDLEEKHKIETKLYMQKIKYIMLKHQDENVDLMMKAEIELKQQEDAHRVKEKDFKYDKRSISVLLKEQEVLQNDFLHALQKDNIKNIHELKNEYELRENQLRNYYRERMKEINFNMEERRKQIIQQINENYANQIQAVTKDHEAAFNNMKIYYSDLNKKNLARLKNLAKNFWDELKEQGVLKARKMKKLGEKKKIEEPLKKIMKENEENLLKEQECIRFYDELKRLRDEYQRMMKEMLDSEYKLEVVLQKIEYLKKEKNEYTKKYKDNLHIVEQKAGLKVDF